jgi:hypothetical protein
MTLYKVRLDGEGAKHGFRSEDLWVGSQAEAFKLRTAYKDRCFLIESYEIPTTTKEKILTLLNAMEQGNMFANYLHRRVWSRPIVSKEKADGR